jgi:protein SDA1
MYSMLGDENSIAAHQSLSVMVELYRKRVWTDSRTVNTIASACLSDSSKVVATAIRFFLGIDRQLVDDEEGAAAEQEQTLAAEINHHRHSKKTAKRAHQTERQQAKRAKVARANQNREPAPVFPAIQLLNDPQGLAERLFRKLRQSVDRFEVKLLMMNFISRLISSHQLLLLNYYAHLQRYLTVHQKDVTQICTFLVQSCHALVPADEIHGIVRHIAHHFITERCAGEAMAVGINTIREVISRVPLLLEEPGMDAFAHELVTFAKHRDKSVVMAAR